MSKHRGDSGLTRRMDAQMVILKAVDALRLAHAWPVGSGFIPMGRLRQEAGLSREDFDRAALALFRGREIDLKAVNSPATMPANERQATIDLPDGRVLGYVLVGE